MAALTLAFEPDGVVHSGYGSLIAHVTAAGFSGHTRHAVAPETFDIFIAGLRALPAPQPLGLVIGAEFEDGPLLAIGIVQTSQRGLFRVEGTIAWVGDRRRRVATSSEADYPVLDAFGGDLQRALREGGKVALRARDGSG